MRHMLKSLKNIGVFETIGTWKHPGEARGSLAAVEICLQGFFEAIYHPILKKG